MTPERLMINSIYDVNPELSKQSTYSFIFKNQVRMKLKHSVKGEVKTHITNDTLIVDIYGANSTVFRYTMKHITSEIVQGFTSEMCCNIIVKRYKSYINNLYFL